MIITLRYSRIPNIPVIGYFFYLLECLLIRLHLVKSFYLSQKEKLFIDIILALPFSKNDELLCQSICFGHVLKHLPGKILIDLSTKNIKPITIENYDQYLFTLLQATEITEQTRKTLHSIGDHNWDLVFQTVQLTEQ